jgi:HEPN domain-containing protein
MNAEQKLWWRQAKSDCDLFDLLRRSGARECHLLQHLQAATEKLSKAYFWRAGHAPPRSHVGFVRFLKALLNRRSTELEGIANSLGFPRAAALEHWVHGAQTLAYELQSVSPAEARDGPNAEYPWPHASPRHCPADYRFSLWSQLVDTGKGRKLIRFINRAIDVFDMYA